MDPAFGFLDIDQGYIDDHVPVEGRLTGLFETGHGIVVAGNERGSDTLGPAAIGIQPYGYAVGQAVGGEDFLHVYDPPCSGCNGLFRYGGERCRAGEIGSGDGIADDHHDRTGQIRNLGDQRKLMERGMQ